MKGRKQAWQVEKRVPNTEHWYVVGYAPTREEAVEKAQSILGGASTGVRICRTDDPYDTPEIVVGV